jgi:hypothetical protein
MLDELVAKFKPATIIEIGTYYAGWTAHLEQISDARIWTFQSPTRLNHLEDTDDGEYSQSGELWKKVASVLPLEYQGRYDFNLLARNVSKLQRTTCLLTDSPLDYEWPFIVDLTIIDCTRNPDELRKHFDYWIRFSRVVALGHYQSVAMPHDISSITHADLFEHCAQHANIYHYSKNYLWATR